MIVEDNGGNQMDLDCDGRMGAIRSMINGSESTSVCRTPPYHLNVHCVNYPEKGREKKNS